MNPVVGVRHQAVERIVAELLGEKVGQYVPPTVSTPIGYVMPQRSYAAWVINETNASEEAASLASSVAAYGLPFMCSMVELVNVRAAIEQGLGHDRDFKLPVVLSLMGCRDEALVGLERAEKKLGEREDPAAEQFRRFALAFRRREKL